MTTPSEKKRFLGLTYTEIGILAILFCVGCVFAGILGRTFIARNLLPSTPRATSTPRPTEEPIYVLELRSMHSKHEYDFMTVEGQVKNISGASLDDITAVVEFYDRNGGFVKSESALIDYNPILAGQTSPFSVITTDNPAIETYTITFKYLLGGTLPLKDGR